MLVTSIRTERPPCSGGASFQNVETADTTRGSRVSRGRRQCRKMASENAGRASRGSPGGGLRFVMSGAGGNGGLRNHPCANHFLPGRRFPFVHTGPYVNSAGFT